MRGQAFEVFRLLIAAVVAGAILMILLGILQGMVTPTQDPQQAAAQLVKKYSDYGGKGTSDVITFTPGSSIYLPGVAAEASMDTECVKGAVDQKMSSRFSTSDEYITYSGKTNYKARLQVECIQETSSGSECPIECTVTVVPR